MPRAFSTITCKAGEVDGGVPAYAMDRYKLLDVNADTTGGTGGDA